MYLYYTYTRFDSYETPNIGPKTSTFVASHMAIATIATSLQESRDVLQTIFRDQPWRQLNSYATHGSLAHEKDCCDLLWDFWVTQLKSWDILEWTSDNRRQICGNILHQISNAWGFLPHYARWGNFSETKGHIKNNIVGAMRMKPNLPTELLAPFHRKAVNGSRHL